jgi:hypothetical protein
MGTNTSFIDDLREDGINVIAPVPHAPVKARETFPCESCGGTGIYRGVRVHQTATECFACKGKGYFFKSFKDRQAARQQAAVRKEKQIATGLQAFGQQYPGLLEGIRKNASWNDFLRDLLAKLETGHDLSDNAIAAAQRTVDKAAARDAERAAANVKRAEGLATINITPIKEAFDKAAAKGLKTPVLRFPDFKVSRAPDHGRNAGALYLKTEGDIYLGKIVDGRYQPTGEAEALKERIVETLANPLELAIAYGRRTGKCSCCGRKLTDPVSVERGIGPVCAENYGW